MSNSDHPVVSFALVSLGFLGTWIPKGDYLSALYFALLIPPAAWHLFAWLKNQVWPEIKRLFKKDD